MLELTLFVGGSEHGKTIAWPSEGKSIEMAVSGSKLFAYLRYDKRARGAGGRRPEVKEFAVLNGTPEESISAMVEDALRCEPATQGQWGQNRPQTAWNPHG